MSDSDPDIYRADSSEKVSYGKFYPLLEELQPFFFYTRKVDGTIDSVRSRVVSVLDCSQEEFPPKKKDDDDEDLRTAEGFEIIQNGLTKIPVRKYVTGIIRKDGHSLVVNARGYYNGRRSLKNSDRRQWCGFRSKICRQNIQTF